MMELAVVGSDIQEVLGSAVAVHFLSMQLVPLWVGVLIGALGSFVMLLADQRGFRWALPPHPESSLVLCCRPQRRCPGVLSRHSVDRRSH